MAPGLADSDKCGDARSMRNTTFFVVSGLLIACSLGCAGGKDATLKPSMVSKDFKDLDDENPFAKKATNVHFIKVGIKKYDAFFQDAAEVKGTVIIADVVLKETDAFIASIKKDVKKGKVLTPSQAKRLKKEQDRLGALTRLLSDVPDRSTKLIDTSEGLAGGAAKTFIGPEAVKLQAVMKGLAQSADALKEAAARSPKVLQHAAKTTTELADFD